MLMAKKSPQPKDVPIIINPTIQLVFLTAVFTTFFVQFGLTVHQLTKYGADVYPANFKLNMMLVYLVPALYWLATFLLHPVTGTLRRLFQSTVLASAVWIIVPTFQQVIMATNDRMNPNTLDTIEWITYVVVGVVYVGALSYLRGSKRRWK